MAEEQVETVVQVAAPKTARKITSYSKTGKLVMDAIVNLNERKGSSIMKIRNYISAKNPEIDMNRYGGIVKKFILSALEKGELKSDDETKKSRGRKKLYKIKCAFYNLNFFFNIQDSLKLLIKSSLTN